jgi:hypothetical protein
MKFTFLSRLRLRGKPRSSNDHRDEYELIAVEQKPFHYDEYYSYQVSAFIRECHGKPIVVLWMETAEPAKYR